MASQRYRAYFGDFGPRFFGVFINFAVFMRNFVITAIFGVRICIFSYNFYFWPYRKRARVPFRDFFYET